MGIGFTEAAERTVQPGDGEQPPMQSLDCHA